MTKEERINKYIEFMKSSHMITELDELGFFDAPASIKYHGAFDGGLFEHSLTTAEALVELTEKLGLKWQRAGSPYIVGMFHDICKCYAYKKENDKWTWNNDIIIPGHGDASVIILQKYLELNDEEIACIRWHMGAYETDTKMWEYYGRAIEKFPNVLYTHTADMIASKIKGI